MRWSASSGPALSKCRIPMSRSSAPKPGDRPGSARSTAVLCSVQFTACGSMLLHDHFVFGFCARRAQKPKTRKEKYRSAEGKNVDWVRSVIRMDTKDSRVIEGSNIHAQDYLHRRRQCRFCAQPAERYFQLSRAGRFDD